MNDANIDRIIESALKLMPNLHKKILKPDLGGLPGNLTWHHLVVMRVLNEGSLTVSHLAKNSGVPKPQMTRLTNQLVELGTIERHPDAADRRVINLELTEHGRIILEDVNLQMKDHLKHKLAVLTTEERAAMLTALETLRSITAKLC
jgi:DNA-binding MarR family transcriptional regulator